MKFYSKIILRAAILAPISLLVFSAAAQADATLPSRKPGLWETTMTMKMSMNGQTMNMGGAPITSAMCSSAATDAESMKRMAGDNGKCSHFNVQGSGNVYTIDGTCGNPMGGAGVVTIHGVITRISDNEVTVQSQTTSSMMSGNMSGDSKWMGACPAGVMAGDFGSMSSGQFVKEGNVLDNMKQLQPPQ